MKHIFRYVAMILLATTAPGALAQDALIEQTVKSGAFADAITRTCSMKNPRGSQQYQQVLEAWRRRNYWDAVLPKAKPGQYDQASTAAVQAIQHQGTRAVFLCLNLNRTLSTVTFDPSQQHARELAQLASGEGSPSATAPVAPGHSSPQVQPPNEQAPAQASTDATGPASQGAAGAASVQGGSGQLGEATFTVPGTWRAGKATASDALFQRPTKDRGEVTIFALQQKPMQGDFKASFSATVRGMFPGKTPELKNVYPAMTRTGLPALYVRDGSQVVVRGRSKSMALRAVGVELPSNQLFVVLLMSSDGFAGKNDAEQELGTFVSSLNFGSQSRRAPWDPLRNPGNGNATGVYWYSTVSLMPNVFGGLDTRAVRKYVVLLPGGHAYRDLPEGGHVTDMDFAATCRNPKKVNDCGSYDIQGSTVRFRWPDDFGLMAESSGAYAPGRSLKNEDHDYFFVAPVSRDFKLNGRYSSFFASSGSNAFTSGSVSVEKFITFTSDGRYQKQGFSAASFSNSNAAGTVGGKKAPSQGTYEINGYTMLLHPAGGAEETYTVILEHQEPHPKAVFIDDDGYLAK